MKASTLEEQHEIEERISAKLSGVTSPAGAGILINKTPKSTRSINLAKSSSVEKLGSAEASLDGLREQARIFDEVYEASAGVPFTDRTDGQPEPPVGARADGGRPEHWEDLARDSDEARLLNDCFSSWRPAPC